MVKGECDFKIYTLAGSHEAMQILVRSNIMGTKKFKAFKMVVIKPQQREKLLVAIKFIVSKS